MRRRAEAVADFLWRHGDAMFVVVVAFGVAILEIFGVPSQGVIDAAILATLGTVALVLFRDRLDRGSLEALEMLASDAISDRPYVVVWQEKQWDLLDRDHVVVTKTEQIRFTRNDVATAFEWSSSDGTVESVVAKWRRDSGMDWIEARKIYEFPIRNGIKTIFCFDDEHNRGDILEWCTEVRAYKRFSATHESVEAEARTKSDHPRALKITWPADTPPSRVEIRRSRSDPARRLTPRRKNGRPYIEEKIAGIAVGEAIKLDWTW